MCATKDAANVPAGGLGPVAAAVEMYPEPLLAHPSQTHQVRVLGAPVFVERYAGVGYARFAMGGSVAVEIEVASPITDGPCAPIARNRRQPMAHDLVELQMTSPSCHSGSRSKSSRSFRYSTSWAGSSAFRT